jgi:hypothetical protein
VLNPKHSEESLHIAASRNFVCCFPEFPQRRGLHNRLAGSSETNTLQFKRATFDLDVSELRAVKYHGLNFYVFSFKETAVLATLNDLSKRH